MLDHQQIRWLLFDLDGTLLTTEKKVTERTLRDLEICCAKGIRIGVVTSRSKENAAQTIGKLHPDLVIASGGGIALYEGRVVYQADISAEETSRFIAEARRILGADAEITADTDSGHYWNYKVDPAQIDQWQGGDIVIFQGHIGVVSDKRNRRGVPFVLHHGSSLQIGYEQDVLDTRGDIVAHFRFRGDLLEAKEERP